MFLDNDADNNYDDNNLLKTLCISIQLYECTHMYELKLSILEGSIRVRTDHFETETVERTRWSAAAEGCFLQPENTFNSQIKRKLQSLF